MKLTPSSNMETCSAITATLNLFTCITYTRQQGCKQTNKHFQTVRLFHSLSLSSILKFLLDWTPLSLFPPSAVCVCVCVCVCERESVCVRVCVCARSSI